MRFSFDFDGCLGDNKSIQLLAKCLVERHEVFILTSRDSFQNNKDVFEVAHKVGIRKKNIIFAGEIPKFEYFQRYKIDLHFDDNMSDVNNINALYADEELKKPALLVNYEFGERNNTMDW